MGQPITTPRDDVAGKLPGSRPDGRRPKAQSGWAAGLDQGRWLLVASAAYVGLTLAVLAGFLSPLRVSPWVILGFLGFAHLGLGLATGRLEALGLTGVPALVAVLEGWPGSLLLDLGLIVVPALLVPLGLGVWLRRAWLDPLDPAQREQTRHSLGVAGVVVLCLGLSPFAAAGFRHLAPRDTAPEQEQLLDEIGGSYRGVTLGDRHTGVFPVFGWPFKRGHRVRPSLQDVRAGQMRYSGVVYGIYRGRVAYIEVTDPRVQTEARVGIGDNLGVARRAYPGLSCGPVRRPSQRWPLLVCSGRARSGRYLSFWSDPITEIRISAGDRSPL